MSVKVTRTIEKFNPVKFKIEFDIDSLQEFVNFSKDVDEMHENYDYESQIMYEVLGEIRRELLCQSLG